MIDKRAQVRRAKALIINKSMESFYGEVILKFESGNIVFMRVAENIKPPTREEFHSLLDMYFDSPSSDLSTEFRIRKINGSPHITLENSGVVDKVITISDMESAEKHRTGI